MNLGARWGGAPEHALEIVRGLGLGITHAGTLPRLVEPLPDPRAGQAGKFKLVLT